jgi:hypothetical protein
MPCCACGEDGKGRDYRVPAEGGSKLDVVTDQPGGVDEDEAAAIITKTSCKAQLANAVTLSKARLSKAKAEYDSIVSQFDHEGGIHDSWHPGKYPPHILREGKKAPFTGSAAKAALKVAATYGMKDALIAAAKVLADDVYLAQLAIASVAGNRNAPTLWMLAEAGDVEEGSECRDVVLNAIAALQCASGVTNLGNLAAELSTLVYSDIPEGNDGTIGGNKAEILVKELNTHPVQDLGLQSPPFAGLIHCFPRNVFEDYSGNEENQFLSIPKIPTAGQEELLQANARMKAGEFGKLYRSMRHSNTRDQPGQRPDFQLICDATEHRSTNMREVNGAQYLIALGMNRNKSFHALGREVAEACGAEYRGGPIKTEERIDGKCNDGGDYFTEDVAKLPNCARVLDILRGSVECKTKAMMLNAYAEAVKRFGNPAVCKDRREKVQHDLLCVFLHEGLYVELQLHYAETIKVKTLAHAVFEVQRLKTDTVVEGSGIYTVIKVPETFEGVNEVQCLLDIADRPETIGTNYFGQSN